MALVVKDGNGANQNLPLYDPAFSFGSVLAPGANPTDIVQLKGSASTIVRVKKILLTLSAGTAAGGQIYTLVRRSTAASGGTAVTPTIAKHNPDSAAATAVLTHYTAAPTAGTLVATLRSDVMTIAATTAATEKSTIVWDFTMNGDQPPTLDGVSDFLCITLSAALATAQTFHYSIEWEEGAE